MMTMTMMTTMTTMMNDEDDDDYDEDRDIESAFGLDSYQLVQGNIGNFQN